MIQLIKKMSFRVLNRVFRNKLVSGNIKPTYCIWRHFYTSSDFLGEASVKEAQRPVEDENKEFLSFFGLPESPNQATDSQVKNTGILESSPCRTTESDPAKHTKIHEGRFYTIPSDDLKHILPKQKKNDINLRKQIQTFQEACIMVRKPALEVIDLIQNQVNYELPAPKIIYSNSWLTRYKEMSISSFKTDRIDLPYEAKDWLEYFAVMNTHLVKEVKTNYTYTWSKRESLQAGASLQELIDFGINRLKFSDDCIGAILKELRFQLSQDRLKVLLAIDGVNAFWNDFIVRSKTGDSVFSARKLSLIHHFLKFLKCGTKNSISLCTIDVNVKPLGERSIYTPLHLLGKEGFEELEPIIPIEVLNYSEDEIDSCYDYYVDRCWIQNEIAKTEEGKKQLIFLSNYSPSEFSKVCITS